MQTETNKTKQHKKSSEKLFAENRQAATIVRQFYVLQRYRARQPPIGVAFYACVNSPLIELCNQPVRVFRRRRPAASRGVQSCRVHYNLSNMFEFVVGDAAAKSNANKCHFDARISQASNCNELEHMQFLPRILTMMPHTQPLVNSISARIYCRVARLQPVSPVRRPARRGPETAAPNARPQRVFI